VVTTGASHIEGRGLFADRAHRPGELVHRMGGRRTSTIGVAARIALRRVGWDDPLQIGRATYLVLDEVSVAANHSCDPNLGIRGEGDLVALRPIADGDELTFDYSLTVPRNVFTRSWHLPCACGTARCRRDVGNVDTVPIDVLQGYLAAGAVPDLTAQRVRDRVGAASGLNAGSAPTGM
jgi:uncharacterized protein